MVHSLAKVLAAVDCAASVIVHKHITYFLLYDPLEIVKKLKFWLKGGEILGVLSDVPVCLHVKFSGDIYLLAMTILPLNVIAKIRLNGVLLDYGCV